MVSIGGGQKWVFSGFSGFSGVWRGSEGVKLRGVLGYIGRNSSSRVYIVAYHKI